MNEYNIAQKVEIIVEHFRTYPRLKISGQNKAKVVHMAAYPPQHIAWQNVFHFIAAGSFLQFEPGTTAR
jgi:hypothetical protein